MKAQKILDSQGILRKKINGGIKLPIVRLFYKLQ